MKLNKRLFAALLLLVCGTAFAEHDHGCGKGKFDPANLQAQRLEHFEQHQEKLHTILQLSSTQENAWKSYLAQMKPQEKEHLDFAALSKLNTLQRLDRMEAWDKERDASRAERAKAIRSFYAQLNDAQKKAFDENAFPQLPYRDGGHAEKSVRE